VIHYRIVQQSLFSVKVKTLIILPWLKASIHSTSLSTFSALARLGVVIIVPFSKKEWRFTTILNFIDTDVVLKLSLYRKMHIQECYENSILHGRFRFETISHKKGK
jgi:hypothetical protein